MKIQKNNLAAWLPGGLAMAALSSWAVWETWGDVPAPVLKATLVSTNQVNVTITNGVSTANYELYWTPVLADPDYPWTLLVSGSLGQTNFGVLMNSTETVFIRAAIGTDWDGDGVANYKDARPSDPSIGTLTVTIESPTNGSTIN
jgi:hypothetical protein